MKDLKGQTFDRLFVLKTVGKRGKHYYWKCRCNCDNKTICIVNGSSLSSGHTKSCGCLNTETRRNKFLIHGENGTLLHKMWSKMRQRCNNKNREGYKNYGGRGITYDPRWEDFLEFKKDMHTKCKFALKFYRKEISKKNPLSLERKDVNGNYCKENCIFIPMNLQGKNTRRLKWFKAINTKTKEEIITNNQSEFARNNNLNVSRINLCLNNKVEQHKDWGFKYIDNTKEDKK